MPDDRWPIEDHELTELWLDPMNVRIASSQAGQSSIAAYLVEAEDVAGLALSIARDGYLDNELPVVASEGGRLMVLEGNRRVTALKLLTDTLAPDDPASAPYTDAAVERIARRHPRTLETTVRVMVAPSREDAQPLLARLHTSNPKKSWLREQQAIFYHAQLDRGRTVDDLRSQFPGADDIPRFIRMGEMRALIRGLPFKDDQLKAWVLDSKLAMTSFEYAYRSPEVLAALGLSFDADGVLVDRVLTDAQSEALQFLLAMFKANALNTRSLEFKVGKKGEAPNATREAFLDTLRGIVSGQVPEGDPGDRSDPRDDGQSANDDAETPGGSEPSGPAGASGYSDAGGSSASGGSGDGSRSPNRGDTRKRLDMTGFAYRGPSAGMRRRIEELAQIDVSSYANAAYDLLRTILECSGKVYLRAHPPARPLRAAATLKDVLSALKQEFASDARILGILNQIDSGGPQSASRYAGTAQSLNAMNHEPDHFSQPSDAHAAWDRIKPLVVELLT